METFLACFKMLLWHTLGGAKEIMKSLKKAGLWDLPNTSNWSCKPRKVTICRRSGIFYWIWWEKVSFCEDSKDLTSTFATFNNKPFPYLYKHGAWIEHAMGVSCLQICLSLCVCVHACTRMCMWARTCVIYETIVFCGL